MLFLIIYIVLGLATARWFYDDEEITIEELLPAFVMVIFWPIVAIVFGIDTYGNVTVFDFSRDKHDSR